MFKYVFFAILAVAAYFVFVFDMQLTNNIIGNLFIGGILSCFGVFLFFKFGLHYKIASMNRFATAFYYSVFEYKKVQTEPSDLDFVDSVREQAEVALAANFDPTLSKSQLAIPVHCIQARILTWTNYAPKSRKRKSSSSVPANSI